MTISHIFNQSKSCERIMNFESCLNKQQALKELFLTCITAEAKYRKIIELGQKLPSLKEDFHTPDNLVQGCQSVMYLSSTYTNGSMTFEVYSEALISKGLAALLLFIYNGETPETILKCPPTVLTELGINQTLTPGRSNGLFNLYLKMKQKALKELSFK